MKAILEALRKEVSQLNAGTPDSNSNLTRCDTSSQQRTRNASSQTMLSSEWSHDIQKLQKRMCIIYNINTRFSFKNNKADINIIFIIFFSDHDKIADPRSSSI